MLKKIIIGLILAIVIIIAGLTYTILTSPTVKAQLHIETGTVLVNGNSATNDMKLSEGDIIETKNGKTTVILHESILVSLEEQTKITLDELAIKNPVVKQTTGTTWNTFMKLAGIDSFSIQTSNSIASVRGTGFQLSENKILTADGTVQYEKEKEIFSVNEMDVVENKNKRKANHAEMEEVKKYYSHAIKELKHMRALEMKKHTTIMRMIKTQYDLSDDDIVQKLDETDKGMHDVDEMKQKMPIKIAPIEKIAGITKEIQRMNEKITGINNS